MGYSGGIITAPVNIRDLQACVPVTLRRTVSGQVQTMRANDVGTHCGAVVGDSVPAMDGGGNWTVIDRVEINKWAKYKPVRYSSIDTIGQWDADHDRWRSNATWWQVTGISGSTGTNPKLYGSCGLQFEVFTELGSISSSSSNTSFLNRLRKGDLPWTYVRQTGGISSPYRMSDFARYYHDAQCPVGGNLPSVVTAEPDGTSLRSFQLGFDCNASDDDMSLSLVHFNVGNKSLTEYYVGVLLYKNENDYEVVTSGEPIGEGGSAVIHAKIGYSDTGKWQVFPFLSSEKIPIGGNYETGSYLSLGWGYEEGHSGLNGGARIEIKDAEHNDISCEALWVNSNRNKIVVTDVTLINNVGGSASFNRVSVIIYRKSKSQQNADWNEVTRWNYVGSVIVPADSMTSLPTTTKTYTNGSGSDAQEVEIDVVHEFTGISYNSSYYYAVGAIADSYSTQGLDSNIEDLFA